MKYWVLLLSIVILFLGFRMGDCVISMRLQEVRIAQEETIISYLLSEVTSLKISAKSKSVNDITDYKLEPKNAMEYK